MELVSVLETIVVNDHSTLTCESSTDDAIDSGGSATFRCMITSQIDPTAEGMHVYNVSLSTLPQGWSAMAAGPNTSLEGATLTFTDVFLRATETATFTLTVSVPCGAPSGDYSITLTSLIGIGSAAEEPSPEPGPGVTLDVNVSGVGAIGSVALVPTDGSLAFGGFSRSDSINASGSSQLHIQQPDCLPDHSPLSVTLSISGDDGHFRSEASDEAGRVPLTALTLTEVTGSGAGLTIHDPPASQVLAGDGYSVATISAPGTGSYDLDLHFALSVPAGSAQPGTHSATLMVTMSGEDPRE